MFIDLTISILHKQNHERIDRYDGKHWLPGCFAMSLWWVRLFVFCTVRKAVCGQRTGHGVFLSV